MGLNSANGNLLQVSISSIFTTIGRRTRIKPNEAERNKIETTDLDSTAETSFGGIPRSGQVELEYNNDEADAAQPYLDTSYAAGTVESWKYILANGKTYSFSGWIMSKGLGEATVDALQKQTIKIQISGTVTKT